MRDHIGPTALAVAVTCTLVAASCGGDGAASAVQPSPAEVWAQRGVALTFGSAGNGNSVIMPEVVQFAPNLYRLYFGARRPADGGWDIRYAESADGAQFTPKGIALAGTTDPLDAEFNIRGESIVRLPDGRWRMYYQATPFFPEGGGAPNPPPYFQMMSAVSSDGVVWTREGVRLSNQHFDAGSLLAAAAHARVIPVTGGYVAYVSGLGRHAEGAGLYRVRSADGLTFSGPADLLVADGHDPFLVRSDGRWRMYVDTTVAGGATTSAALFASDDGIEWSVASTATFRDANGNALLVGGVPGTGDLGGLVMPDGKLRLFGNAPMTSIVWFERTSP